MDGKTSRIARLAMCTALAMILSFVESRLPSFTAVPGVKMGLANIAVIFALYRLGRKDAIIISAVRVVLVSILFGTVMSLFYSIAGAVLSFLVMALLRKSAKFSSAAVSVAGGVSHNLGQTAMACLILETDVISYYLPFLILSGTLAGILTGVAAAVLIKRIKLQ